jgi:hypothetical protein
MIFSSGGINKGNVKNKEKKDTHMIMGMKQHWEMDLWRKEQGYFEKMFREQERKGEVFKIKQRVKPTEKQQKEQQD